ncbi:glycosyltransferase family 4 protein [Tetragenococcus halophilus]|uniref:glycosyltransferase family 4 protein n=1 Tax=Tetragenococcus halophilus TaxID=51669 RepID=UPI00209AA3B1|nr:glycosyltransferase family 4 protein [Tetragenococcus halophilus]
MTKNIWIFHHYATPPTMNGFTRPYDFGVKLKKMGYNITVFSASHLHFSNINLITDKSLYMLNEETQIPFVFVRTPSSSGNGIGRVNNMVAYYRNLFKVTKSFAKNVQKPDLIIGSSPHPLSMVAAIKIAKKFDIPCINEVRDFWPEVIFLGGKLKEKSLFGQLLVKGEHWIYKKSDALIFLKEGDYTYISDRKWDSFQGGDIDLDKCFYINNGVDIKAFDELKKNGLYDVDLKSNKFNVVYTGAIRPINNIDNLLDAAKIIQSQTSNIQFLIYGDGNQMNRLKKRVLDEKINNVKMKGYVEKKYIPYILSESSINVLTYSQNKYNWSRGNSSNKLFEYMASGKPIISTVKMGYSPIEKYNCGISLENGLPEELAEAVMKIYSMSDETYNKINDNARKGALDFDYKKLAEKLYTVLESQLQ